jgi:DNA modification methylase
MSDEYVKIIEEIESWWKAYKEILKPEEIMYTEDSEEMILRWTDYNERDLGFFDYDTLVEMTEELEIFK